MMRTTEPPSQDAGTRAACLQRLATALAGYEDLEATVRAESPEPFLMVRNTAVPAMSETIAITRLGNGLVFLWSWGKRISDASDPDSAAHAIAYVLAARGAQLGSAR